MGCGVEMSNAGRIEQYKEEWWVGWEGRRGNKMEN